MNPCLEVAEGVGTLCLDRPPMNALNTATQDRLKELAEEAARRDDVRAVVVYVGEKAFAAGADIKEMQAMDHTAMVLRARALQDAFTAVAALLRGAFQLLIDTTPAWRSSRRRPPAAKPCIAPGCTMRTWSSWTSGCPTWTG